MQQDDIKTRERTFKPFHKGIKSAEQQHSPQMGQQEANKKADTYQPTRQVTPVFIVLIVILYSWIFQKTVVSFLALVKITVHFLVFCFWN